MSLSLKIRGSWPSIYTSMEEPFLLSLLLLLPARGEGRSRLAMGDRSAGPHGAVGWVSHWHRWMRLGALQCVTWISSSF